MKRHIECIDNDLSRGFNPKTCGVLAGIYGNKHMPASQVGQMQVGSSVGGASGMRQCAKRGILVVLVLRLGFTALATRSMCVAGASKH